MDADYNFQELLNTGYILFTVNGLFNIFAATLTIMNKKGYEFLIIYAGLMLTIWLTIQIIIIKLFFPPLHLTYYIIGLIMITSGLMLRKYRVD
jgi:hypothetical protein